MAHSKRLTISRKELSVLSGLSVRHLSRIGGDVPDARRTGGYHKFTYFDTPRVRSWAEWTKRMPKGQKAKEKPFEFTAEHRRILDKECKTDKERTAWEDAAKRALLSPKALRASIRAGEIRACAPKAAGARWGMPMIERVAMEFGLFAPKVYIGDYSIETAESVLEQLAPIREWIRQVEAHRDKLRAKVSMTPSKSSEKPDSQRQ